MNNKANELIESQTWITRELSRYSHCCIVSLGNADYREMVGFYFCQFFFDNPNGESDKYTWETRRVDDLRNLYIWTKKG